MDPMAKEKVYNKYVIDDPVKVSLLLEQEQTDPTYLYLKWKFIDSKEPGDHPLPENLKAIHHQMQHRGLDDDSPIMENPHIEHSEYKHPKPHDKAQREKDKYEYLEWKYIKRYESGSHPLPEHLLYLQEREVHVLAVKAGDGNSDSSDD